MLEGNALLALFTCPCRDHHADALAERFGTPKWVTALANWSFGLTRRDSEWAKGSLGLRRVSSGCGAKIGCCSAAPSAFRFGRTLRDPEEAKGSSGLSSTQVLNCSGCVAAACLANTSTLRVIGFGHIGATVASSLYFAVERCIYGLTDFM